MEGCLFFCRVWTSKARITKQVHTTALTSISILGIYFGVISILIWYTEFIGSAFYTIRFRAGFIRKAEERMDPEPYMNSSKSVNPNPTAAPIRIYS